MFKVMSFLARKPGTTPAEFRDYYENHHVPLITSLAPSPPTYRRNYLSREEPLIPGEAIGFDVVTEQAFPDKPAFEAWLAVMRANGEKVREDEARFLDHSRYFAYFVDERVTRSA